MSRTRANSPDARGRFVRGSRRSHESAYGAGYDRGVKTPAIERILFTTDLSEAAKAALPAAVALAKRHRAALHLLHVLEPLPNIVLGTIDSVGLRALERDVLRECEQSMRKLVEEVGTGVTCKSHVLDGSPAEIVASFVREHDVDLVVLATAGRTGIERFALGSVAERIVRNSPCSVLVARDQPASWERVARVLVASDFSDMSSRAVTAAADLARPYGAELVLLHVLEDAAQPTGRALQRIGIVDMRERMHKETEQMLEKARAAIVPALRSRSVVREGTPARTIAAVVKELAADIVVIATHSRTGLLRFVLGSTAERTVRLAPCSVLVHKEREE